MKRNNLLLVLAAACCAVAVSGCDAIRALPNNYKDPIILNNDKSKKIIDIGAGTGRYSVYLDSLGYDVTAVELVQHNIDVFKNKKSNVKIHQ